VLTVFLAVWQTNNLGKNRPSVKAADPSSVEIAGIPKTSPLSTSTSSPSFSADLKLAQGYVLSALNTHSRNPISFDPETMSGNVFECLVSAVVDQISRDNTRRTTFDALHSHMYLKENYALGMLFKTKIGTDWKRNQSWLSHSDPRNGWKCISCSTRKNGTQAMRRLDLGKQSAKILFVWTLNSVLM
jgi:hypothetical protein